MRILHAKTTSLTKSNETCVADNTHTGHSVVYILLRLVEFEAFSCRERAVFCAYKNRLFKEVAQHLAARFAGFSKPADATILPFCGFIRHTPAGILQLEDSGSHPPAGENH